MPSLQARLIRAFSRRAIRREGLDEDRLVRHLRRVFNNPPPIALKPRGVRFTRLDCAGFTGERCTLAGHEPQQTVLYLHGGAYIAGTTRTYHPLAAQLARGLKAEVFLAEYPFAPEQRFPAAVDRCVEAYRFLLDEGKSPADISIAGDSAGGGLTLALLLALHDQGLPMPRCAVLISPGGSCFPSSYVATNSDRDVMLSADMIEKVINVYVGDGDRNHRYASPALADLTGLPPLMITVERTEVLYGDALDIRWRAEEAGVPVSWLEREGLCHVWPVFTPLLPEAREDVAAMIQFINDCATRVVASARTEASLA